MRLEPGHYELRVILHWDAVGNETMISLKVLNPPNIKVSFWARLRSSCSNKASGITKNPFFFITKCLNLWSWVGKL